MVKIVNSAEEWDEICRLAGGRRRYNAQRKFLAEMRRIQLVKLFDKYDPFEWGSRKKLAEELGVSEATISRDIAKLLYQASRPDLDSPAAQRRRWAFQS
jgi:hypothetical protein